MQRHDGRVLLQVGATLVFQIAAIACGCSGSISCDSILITVLIADRDAGGLGALGLRGPELEVAKLSAILQATIGRI